MVNRVRDEQLALCRRLLNTTAPSAPAATGEATLLSLAGDDSRRCPRCRRGTLELVARTLRPRVSELVGDTYQPRLFDSS
jgi:hypothetical protein